MQNKTLITKCKMAMVGMGMCNQLVTSVAVPFLIITKTYYKP
jgi:hypothetical protein